MKKLSSVAKILALETTDLRGGVALCENGEIVAFSPLPVETRSARSLAPTIRDILNRVAWRPGEIDAVAVANGPGSFTGLRVGVATAKMFAWSVGARIIAVDALEAIASETKITTTPLNASTLTEAKSAENWTNGAILSVGLDAQRGDAVVRRFWIARDGSRRPTPLDERLRLISLKKWLDGDNELEFADRLACEKNAENNDNFDFGLFLDKIKTNERPALFFGGSALYRRKNKSGSAENGLDFETARFVDEKYWNPTAIGVAKVAWRKAQNGEFDDVWQILPVYSRKAAAEERLDENGVKK